MNEKAQKPSNADARAAELPDNVEADRGPAVQTQPAGGSSDPEPGPRPTEGQPTNGETMSAAEQIAQLKLERDELRDQALRARAEFVNYQKRAKQQADADRAYAVGSLARDLLDPLDNLDRAIEALRAKGALGVTEGLDLVQKQLLEILAKHGVELIPAQGNPFDPNRHDAILQQPSLEHPEGTVVAELGKGYTIGDRVLRPSKVAVSVKPTSKGE